MTLHNCISNISLWHPGQWLRSAEDAPLSAKRLRFRKVIPEVLRSFAASGLAVLLFGVAVCSASDPVDLLKDALPTRRLPMVKVEAQKYALGQGIRKFRKQHGRWPSSFDQIREAIQAENPAIDLSPLSENQPVDLTPLPGGGLKAGKWFRLMPDGSGGPGTPFVE